MKWTPKYYSIVFFSSYKVNQHKTRESVGSGGAVATNFDSATKQARRMKAIGKQKGVYAALIYEYNWLKFLLSLLLPRYDYIDTRPTKKVDL